MTSPDLTPTAQGIVQSVLARYIETAYRTMLAGLGDLGDEPAQRKAVEQMRHLHLAEPWLPAHEAVKDLVEAGYMINVDPEAWDV